MAGHGLQRRVRRLLLGPKSRRHERGESIAYFGQFVFLLTLLVFLLTMNYPDFLPARARARALSNTNATQLFRKAKETAGKEPKTLITDGLRTYGMALTFEFPHTAHIKEIRLTGAIHNNKMERMNGEIRDREKTMRGLKRMDSPIIKGFQIFHNYVRPHMGLGGRTPAEAAGIKVEGENKWITLIQNGALSHRVAKAQNPERPEKSGAGL